MNSESSNFSVLLRAEELRQQNAKLRRAKALREAYGINFYRPHAKQDIFHRAAHITGRYCRTGNRGGKTKCGAAEDVSFALGERPFYRETFDVIGMRQNAAGVYEPYVARTHPGGEDNPLITHGIPQRPLKILLIVTDWDKATEIFTNNVGSYDLLGEYFQLIPAEALDPARGGGVHRSRGGHIDRIDIARPQARGGGVSSIYIDTIESYKHARMSAESSDFDIIHLDEPCPQAMFTAHKRGLVDRKGKFWINCTPIEEMWINDEFVPPKQRSVTDAPEGYSFNKLGKDVQAYAGSRFIITWSAHDNPHNTPEAIEEFASGLTREERECRISGLPIAMAGLVYKEFIYDHHVLCDVPKGWQDYHLPPADYTIRIWWDYHTRIPQAVLFFATAPDGTVYVYDELFDDNLIDPVAKAILSKTAGRYVNDYEIDPFALIKHPVTEESIQDTLNEYGLFFDPATKDLTRGIHMVRQRLMARTPGGHPTIFFSPHLQQTLYEFNHYVYDLKKQEPKDADNHMMENLYRACLNGLAYVAPPPPATFTPRPFAIRDNIDLSWERNPSLSTI